MFSFVANRTLRPLVRKSPALTLLGRGLTTVIPKNLQPTEEEITKANVTTKGKEYRMDSPPANVRPDIWQLVVSTIMRVDPTYARVPKRSVLHWLLQNTTTREELDVAIDVLQHWRMRMLPITQATTQIVAETCIRLEAPDVFVAMLMDRWKYRQLPINYNMAKFIRFLGGERLDDAFRLFALYPFYGLKYDAPAYGALVEACCQGEGEEAWRRALIVAEEGLASDPPLITKEALAALEKRSVEKGEDEMAKRYQSLADSLSLEPVSEEPAKFDEKGNHLV
ncbi:hypothetical protein GGH91_001077 [Coemansia sp. RSA 2671]|uniref:Uncharacterized protein n=1 Tax=Coemansia linderi TaxID=2663919 RepID=A0ACC1KKL3_9FUNG|nr:hypothetical protein GGH91_001077 [Coemansia sp. RSA 2671]KAJ2791235.1 hypothetical protein GGI18_001278 [Coemansia linderi]